MTLQYLAKTSAILLVACGVFFPLGANSEEVEGSIPFETTPEGFADYLNSGNVKWGDNSKNNFYNPRNCNLIKNLYGKSTIYECDMDFDTITSLGERTCINHSMQYWISINKVKTQTQPFFGGKQGAECGEWEKVSTTQEPQERSTPPENPSPQATPAPEPNSITLLDYQILGGGAVLFLVGGGVGVLLSKLMNRR